MLKVLQSVMLMPQRVDKNALAEHPRTPQKVIKSQCFETSVSAAFISVESYIKHLC